MMNSNSTPKIVVGIGLAAVFGVAVSIFALQAKHESELARNAPPPALTAPSDQNASDFTAPTPSTAAQTSADQAAPTISLPPAAPAGIAPTAAPPAPPTPPTTNNSTNGGVDRHLARTRNSASTSDTRVASAAPAGATAEPATDVSPAATSSEPVASDSQITAAVKSEIASTAPSGNVDVTTTNGTVVLAGSVPSQDNVDQASQAARSIPGVKHVDASALTVSNQ